jgi:hypothetical protein
MEAVTAALLTPQRPSLLGIDLVKAAAIGKMGFVGFFPATKGLLNGEQVELGELLGVFGLGLDRNRAVNDPLAPCAHALPIYKYLNFNQIDEYVENAKNATV